MTEKARIATPVLFGVALLCFALPFVNVSCQGRTIASISGIAAMTGTTIDASKMFDEEQIKQFGAKMASEIPSPPGQSKFELNTKPDTAPDHTAQAMPPQKTSGSPVVIVAFLCGLAGLAVTLFAARRVGTVPAVLGGAGALLLFIFKTRAESLVPAPIQGFVQIDVTLGFWVSLLAFAGAAGCNIMAAKEAAATAGEPELTPAPPARPAQRVSRAYPTYPEDGAVRAESQAPLAPAPERTSIPVSGVGAHEEKGELAGKT